MTSIFFVMYTECVVKVVARLSGDNLCYLSLVDSDGTTKEGASVNQGDCDEE